MKVPFNDLRMLHDELRADFREAFERTLDASAFVGGPAVRRFETHFAAFCNVPHAIGVANGTEALRVALQALGVGPGQAVVTVPNTFIATVEAITLVGAQPVFVDIDPETYNMDPAAVQAYLETRCRREPGTGRAVDGRSGATVTTLLPVHLYGLPADMQALHAIAQDYHLQIVEDACQAHGATYVLADGEVHKAGSTGAFGAFSMYPGKNLGALGEAGAVITRDAELADKARLFINHGQTERYIHSTPHGTNGRIDAMQAAFLDIKLPHLDRWNDCRREVAEQYRERLAGTHVVAPRVPDYGTHIYHVYMVQVEHRDQVRQQLAEAGVETGLHYPVPLHLQAAYSHMEQGPGSFPVTEHVAERLLSLPMYPHLRSDQVDYVCEQLKKVTR